MTGQSNISFRKMYQELRGLGKKWLRIGRDDENRGCQIQWLYGTAENQVKQYGSWGGKERERPVGENWGRKESRVFSLGVWEGRNLFKGH